MDWHHTPKVRDYMSRIDLKDLHVGFHYGIPGLDYLSLDGQPTADLRVFREAHVARQMSMTFKEACDAGRGRDFLALYNEQPTEQEALEEYFAPLRFRVTRDVIELHRYTQIWRAEARRAVEAREMGRAA